MHSEQKDSGQLIASKSSSKVTIAEIDAQRIIELLNKASFSTPMVDGLEEMADKLQRYLDNRPD